MTILNVSPRKLEKRLKIITFQSELVQIRSSGSFSHQDSFGIFFMIYIGTDPLWQHLFSSVANKQNSPKVRDPSEQSWAHCNISATATQPNTSFHGRLLHHGVKSNIIVIPWNHLMYVLFLNWKN